MQTKSKYDVIVIGGGVAGICAAIQSAREGVSTLLVEKSGILGGTNTLCHIPLAGLFHTATHQVIAGIGWDIAEKTLDESNGNLPNFNDLSLPFHSKHIRLDPGIFASICDEAVIESGADLMLHTMLAEIKQKTRNWHITLCTKSGLIRLRTRILIDCTGDANAVAMCNGPLMVPESTQPATLSCSLAGYDIETLDFAAIDKAFSQAVSAGIVRPEDGCCIADKMSVEGFLKSRGENANHIRCDAAAATSEGRTRMEIEGRRAVRRLTRWLRTRPGLERLSVEWMANEIGIRETVRIKGEETVTVNDYASGRMWDDALCYSFYPIDLHGITSKDWNQWELEQGVLPTVPRGALVPENTRNLLAAGRIISSDRLANSALRVQATCMATGQAAGAIAACTAKARTDISSVPIDDIRTVLRNHSAIVPPDRPWKIAGGQEARGQVKQGWRLEAEYGK